MGLRLHLYLKITVPTKHSRDELESISMESLRSARVQLLQRRMRVQLYMRRVTAPRNTLILHPQPYISHLKERIKVKQPQVASKRPLKHSRFLKQVFAGAPLPRL